jgi:hypothetical protein
MLRSGMLIETEDHALPCPYRPGRHAAVSILDTPGQKARLPAVAAAMMQIIGARFSIRHRTLYSILQAVDQARCPWPRSGKLEPTELQAAASAFEMTSRFLRSHDQCLPRSIALAHYLAARNLPAELVMGVKLRPLLRMPGTIGPVAAQRPDRCHPQLHADPGRVMRQRYIARLAKEPSDHVAAAAFLDRLTTRERSAGKVKLDHRCEWHGAIVASTRPMLPLTEEHGVILGTLFERPRRRRQRLLHRSGRRALRAAAAWISWKHAGVPMSPSSATGLRRGSMSFARRWAICPAILSRPSAVFVASDIELLAQLAGYRPAIAGMR